MGTHSSDYVSSKFSANRDDSQLIKFKVSRWAIDQLIELLKVDSTGRFQNALEKKIRSSIWNYKIYESEKKPNADIKIDIDTQANFVASIREANGLTSIAIKEFGNLDTGEIVVSYEVAIILSRWCVSNGASVPGRKQIEFAILFDRWVEQLSKKKHPRRSSDVDEVESSEAEHAERESDANEETEVDEVEDNRASADRSLDQEAEKTTSGIEGLGTLKGSSEIAGGKI